jgi:hypothetical protein
MSTARLWLFSCATTLVASVALPVSALPCLLPPDPLPAEADCDYVAQQCTRRNTACILAEGTCDDVVLDCGCALPTAGGGN